MGIFENSCSKCGSIEHTFDDCPHGMFSTKCSKCGSTEHTFDDCPHGMFSTKCSKCGSTEHTFDDCPHGIFGQSEKDSRRASANSNLESVGLSAWDVFSQNLAAVGGVVGAILGLINAIETADSFVGYVISITVGAVAGAAAFSIFTTLLPWFIGIAIIALVIKSCT